uniref:Zinc finger protein 706 n=1 Tax=Equus caballus TaxID=9796 RepID=A0A9L0SK21_HORSE
RRRTPGNRVGAPGWIGRDCGGHRRSQEAAGRPRLPGDRRARPVPARAAGKRGSSGACQALQVAGSQAGRGSGAVTLLPGDSSWPVSRGWGSPWPKGPGVGQPRPPGDMARGQQKIQSQQKNAKKQAGQKKKQGHDQKAAAKAALIYTCTVCRTQMPDPKTFKQHFESKHPKTPLPPELADVQA